jgi:hypothetical protein
MNPEEMIDYALGRLEPDGSRRDDREREGEAGIPPQVDPDAELPEQLARLTRAVHQLLDDGMSWDPPPGLTRRTVILVAQHRRPSRSFQDLVPMRLPFRWPDLAVAASILIVGTLTLVPLLQYARDRHNNAACMFNLGQIGRSLAVYASANQTLPYPPQDQRDAHSGTFAALLHDAHALPDLSVLDCPVNGYCSAVGGVLPHFEELESLRKTDPERYKKLMCWDYAYHVGYRHPTGGVGPVDERVSGQIPVLADQPDHSNSQMIQPGNSPNHGGRGQNVLFKDGNVRWLPHRFVSPQDPDIFLNNERLPRPGVHARDSALMPSQVPFQGR